jgi:hypothetical protein
MRFSRFTLNSLFLRPPTPARDLTTAEQRGCQWHIRTPAILSPTRSVAQDLSVLACSVRWLALPTLSSPALADHASRTTDFSVWHRVKAPTGAFALWALLVWALERKGMMPMASSGTSSLVGILSMVTGLMVSFRSGSSYDR